MSDAVWIASIYAFAIVAAAWLIGTGLDRLGEWIARSRGWKL